MKSNRTILRPLINIDETEEFYRGTLLRKYNVHSNRTTILEENNYYDYLLVHLLWDKENMIVVNITNNNSKRGSVYTGSIPIKNIAEGFTVNKKGFQHTFGNELKDWYLIESDSTEL